MLLGWLRVRGPQRLRVEGQLWLAVKRMRKRQRQLMEVEPEVQATGP